MSILVLQSSWWGRGNWLLYFVFLVSCGCCVALPHNATGLTANCDCGISWSYSLFLSVVTWNEIVWTVNLIINHSNFSYSSRCSYTCVCQILSIPDWLKIWKLKQYQTTVSSQKMTNHWSVKYGFQPNLFSDLLSQVEHAEAYLFLVSTQGPWQRVKSYQHLWWRAIDCTILQELYIYIQYCMHLRPEFFY